MLRHRLLVCRVDRSLELSARPNRELPDVCSHEAEPQPWIEMVAPRGGTWLMLPRDSDDVLVIAPPAVALQASETLGQLRHWRLVCWPLDDQGRLIDEQKSVAEPVTAPISEVLEEYPGLTNDDVLACLTYAGAILEPIRLANPTVDFELTRELDPWA